MQQIEIFVNSSYVLFNAIDVDASSTFNLHMNIQTNMFVAMEIYNDNRAKGIPFFFGKGNYCEQTSL
jgi:hypothetical protein